MKKKKWKIIAKSVVYLAMLALFVGFLSFLRKSAQETAKEEMAWEPDLVASFEEGWVLVAENEVLELYFEPSLVQVLVKDKQTDAEWRSNPTNAAEDSIAFGQNRMLVQSLIEVSYVDEQSSYYTVNSYFGSTQNKNYGCEYQENGVAVHFQFAKQGFEIPCYFGIEGDHFVARVGSDIQQHGSLQVASITLLPFFGAGGLEDEGYMVVPDGSGALIYYNNQKQAYQSYTQKVYGRDLAVNLQTSSTVAQSATMPIFGIRKNENALLAVITEGEYQAEIKAEVARRATSNNAVCSTIYYIQSENNTLLAGSDNEETAVMLSPQHKEFPYYEVSYYFLGEGAGYSEMAARYRQYLIEEKGMQGSVSVAGNVGNVSNTGNADSVGNAGNTENVGNVSNVGNANNVDNTGNTNADRNAAKQELLHLSFIGGVEVRKTMLGIPYHAVEALTEFQDLADAALELQGKIGNHFQVSLQYFEKGGSVSKIPTKLTYASALGGKKGYQKLSATFEKEGISFYPIYDPIRIRKSGNGYRAYQGVQNVSRSAAVQYEYMLTSGSRDTGKNSYYLVSPRYMDKIMGFLLSAAKKKGVSTLGLAGITDSIYSDFRTNSISANETGEYWESALAAAAEGTEGLLLSGAYAYAFPYADVITNVPIFSSQYDIEDEAIPFYEMAVSGSASLYSAPINESGNTREMLLRAIEYGVAPSFLLMTARADILQDTDYQKYYSLCYEDWQEMIEATAEELASLDGILGQEIISHRKVEENVYATAYQDGTVVYVNYGKNDVTAENVAVPARGFSIKGQKGVE